MIEAALSSEPTQTTPGRAVSAWTWADVGAQGVITILWADVPARRVASASAYWRALPKLRRGPVKRWGDGSGRCPHRRLVAPGDERSAGGRRTLRRVGAEL